MHRMTRRQRPVGFNSSSAAGRMLCGAGITLALLASAPARADSVNSPNITLNVDANRSTGPGAGNTAVSINTITLAETMLPEYASGGTNRITIQARPGFQFDSTSNVTIQSATLGFNGGAINTSSILTPSGAADELLTFNLTSGGSATVQDIIRINGIRLKILNAAGAAGPAQTTLSLTTATAGGAFTSQGIVAASITKGAPDRLVFSAQPGSNEAGTPLLPSVSIADFGGNIVTSDPRSITMTLAANPGSAALLGITQIDTSNGVAGWQGEDNLRITVAAAGYTLRATHGGAAFLTSDNVDSAPFDISAGPPGQLVVTNQPVTTTAGGDILVDVTAQDQFGNPITAGGVPVTLDSAVNPGGWPLLVDTSLTKTTVGGVASWGAADHLRINRQTTAYRLSASGLGSPVLTGAFDIIAAQPNRLVITQQPVDTVAGSPILISVTARDSFDNTVTAVSVPVTLSLAVNPGAATLLTDSSLSKNTSNGVATWSIADALRINVAGSGYRIAASGLNVSTQSDAFDVLVGSPSTLRFVQHPTSTQSGAVVQPPVSVEIADSLGNRTAAALPVNLTLLTAPCGGSLANAQVTSANGLAVFNGLQFDTACAGNVLAAVSTGLVSATSNPVEITAPPRPAPAVCGAGVATLSPLMLAPLLLMRRRQRTYHCGR